MVTARRRRGALALPLLENRLDSNASTAGPFTLNKTDPKVSVSAAHVDRVGLHVSLTIPLESSVTPRAATNHKSRPARKETRELWMPSSPLALLPNGTDKQKDTLVEPNAGKSTDSASQRVSTSTSKQATPGSVRKNGIARTRRTPSAAARAEPTLGEINTSLRHSESSDILNSPDGALRTPKNNLHTFDNPEVDAQYSPSAPPPGHNKRSKKLQYSPVAIPSAMRPPESIDARRGRQRLPLSGQPSPHHVILSRSMVPKSSKRTCSGRLHLSTVTKCARRNSLRAVFSPANTAPTPTNTSPSFCFLRASMDCFTLKKVLWAYRIIFARVISAFRTTRTSGAARRAEYALLGASLVALLFWTDLTPLPATLWAGLHRCNSAAATSHYDWQRATGAFFLADSPELQRECSIVGNFCAGGDEILCGFPVDSSSNGCVALGQDVAAKSKGGSIDYAQTSGTVSHGALVVSQLLHSVASFAMPKLGHAAMVKSPPLNTVSEGGVTKLLQSYYPLYNHTNDPGCLVADNDATYVIQDKHGQITIALARQSLIFAVAMEAPTTTDPDGRCESVEMRWFSVYVQLEGQEKTACRVPSPRGDGLEKGHAGNEEWCRVGRFEYRCQKQSALQVFCLDNPPGPPRQPPPWASRRSTACRNGKAWQTRRVRIVLNENWGASATRLRRLRVLAFP
ncbi:hypothetical protein, conserved [Eimeria acervulina]|uniref:Uncharacterized protein n=1 Tax=Eimeria acervulina TaxID=5801 RepID=U6GQ15_EIMAC|nr:hypothetical protein, conserved [Eimeria acervulina]CDI82311.1 hypothetical protein, conserved [Eimeria acervulina]